MTVHDQPEAAAPSPRCPRPLARLTNRSDHRLWTIGAVLATVTALTGAEIALLFIASGLLMVAVEAPPRWLRRRPRLPAIGLLPLPTYAGVAAKAVAATAGAGTLLTLAWLFAKAGALTFGSGLAIVPFLRDGVVHQHHWLTESQFLDAVAVGLPCAGLGKCRFTTRRSTSWDGPMSTCSPRPRIRS